MKVYLANPRGFCAGVDRAIEIVERTLKKYGAPIYVRHEVVHNRFVVDDLQAKGAVFVDKIDDIPQDAVIIFSAHGVSLSVRQAAQQKTKIIFDATCPLVTKVHKEVAKSGQNNEQVILIGHAHHPEVEGTLGQSIAPNNIHLVENIGDVSALELTNDAPLSYTTQTTLSVDDTRHIVDALANKFAHIKAPHKSDICYATQNRQNAVKTIMQKSEVLLVIGSTNSSNSNRLKEIALKQGKPAYLIDTAAEIQQSWLVGVGSIGVTAGASAPEVLVQNVIRYLKTQGVSEVIEVSGNPEAITFPLPKALR